MTRRRLILLLALSYALRIWLAVEGGQRFWPDESRYISAQSAASELGRGEFSAALADLFAHSDHVLFRIVSLPAALADLWTGGRAPLLAPCYFAIFSVGSIYLIWSVCLRSGGSEREALWCAYFAATANTLFLYSRHFLPYDMALFVMLVALRLAVGPFSRRSSFLTGMAVGAGFLTYNGYWLLGGAVLVLHACLGRGGRPRLLERALFAAAGAASLVAAVIITGARYHEGLVASYHEFSLSIRQGDFYIGYRLIPEYLWKSEGGILFIWAAALGIAVLTVFRLRTPERAVWWLGGIAVVASGLVVFSDIIPRFVIYGRLVREMVPFICLGAGFGVSRFLESRVREGKPWSIGIFVTVLCIALSNFSGPLALTFPDGFTRLAREEIGRQSGQGYGFFQLIYAEPLFVGVPQLELPVHAELLRSPNTMDFQPYRYEGLSARDRRLLDRTDVAMRLIELPGRLDFSRRDWDGFPGPVRLRVTFPQDRIGETEPIVVSGAPGRSDVVFVHYLDSHRVALGLAHWNSPNVVSQPVEIDVKRSHELVISVGFLVPPEGDRAYSSNPELVELSHRIVIILDGRVVLSEPASVFPSTPAGIVFGVNVLGGSSTGVSFAGKVSDFTSASVEQVAVGVPSMAIRHVVANRPLEWAGAVGPLRVRFELAEAASTGAAASPLVSIKDGVDRQTFYVLRAGADTVRIGFERNGKGALLSNEFNLSESGVQQLDILSGSLLPATNAAIFDRLPGFRLMRSKAYARFNGQKAFLVEDRFKPAQPEDVTIGEAAGVGAGIRPTVDGNILSVTGIGPENIPSFGSRATDLLENRDVAWEGFLGPLDLKMVFPEKEAGAQEPILASGVPGASDVIFVRYDSSSQIRFGLHHSGAPALYSEPVAIEPGAVQDVFVSIGSLMPPVSSTVYTSTPELSILGGVAQVGLNGVPILFEYVRPFPANLDEVTVGSNSVEDPLIEKSFRGIIDSLSRAAPMAGLLEGEIGKSLERPEWDGYPGPLAMTIVFPSGRPGDGEPILTTGVPGIADFIFLLHEPNGMARICQDHWGSKLIRSEPFELDAGTARTLVVSVGSLFPPLGAQLYQREPGIAALREKTVVYLDGKRILTSSQVSFPTTPDRITLGANLLGGSSTRPIFSGRISAPTQALISSISP